MVAKHLEARGISQPEVLAAMHAVPREGFLPEALAEFAYADAPLPIGDEQTISQPFIVALMAEALELGPDDKVLEVGAGSGYAAAVLSRIVRRVWTIERIERLATQARERMHRLGYDNVEVVHGDGSLGLPEHAPYDAIVVAAGGPTVPRPLLEQLAIDGRLVIPVGREPRDQTLVRVRRVAQDEYLQENLGAVRFVPLIGAAGWSEAGPGDVQGVRGDGVVLRAAPQARSSAEQAVVDLVRESAEPFDSITGVALGSLLERIGEGRVVLLGEATHGSSEFYRMRARLSRELIIERAFNLIAIEGDWPDVAAVNRYVRGRSVTEARPPFRRFPTWMWRNREFATFVEWLKQHNSGLEPERQVGVVGLDLYSLYASRDAVLRYLERVDPATATVARTRYGCLSPWEQDPAAYGRATLTRQYRSCESEAVAMLVELLRKQIDLELATGDGEEFFDALQNARVVVDAERYYRVMYYGHVESWNLRDRHMFETLVSVLEARGAEAKAVVWAHNSHVGDARATEMGRRGELNIGQLTREAFGAHAYAIGFGTDHGTVAAATDWDGPLEVKQVRPSRSGSYESLCHRTGREAFFMHLREPVREAVREELETPRLERAIGVIYRPETELASHYFQASLPEQFDTWIWFDRTHAVEAFESLPSEGMADTYPFGL
jgi:protein-L-isoaspartate(D-aspartate) O-methyltransferase